MERPTNGELKIMIDNLSKDSEEKHRENKEILNEIRADGKETKKQVAIANGRTNKLEWWQSAVMWGLGALWTLIILFISIALPMIIETQKENKKELQDQIGALVESALAKYDKVIINN